jgi:hypothetical protein
MTQFKEIVAAVRQRLLAEQEAKTIVSMGFQRDRKDKYLITRFINYANGTQHIETERLKNG